MDLELEYRRMQYSCQVTTDDLVKTSAALRRSEGVLAQIRDLCQDRISDGLGVIPEEVLDILDHYDVR